MNADDRLEINRYIDERMDSLRDRLYERLAAVELRTLQIKSHATDTEAAVHKRLEALEALGAGDALRAADDEVRRLKSENVRLQSDLDELLGTEFFKTGERLRRGAAAVLVSDLFPLLLDERAQFWLRLVLYRCRDEFEDASVQVAVAGLFDWRRKADIYRQYDQHLSPTSTEE